MHAWVTPVRRVRGLLLVAVVLLAGCKVDARVDVTLRADGSGTVAAKVTLDAEAVQRLTTGGSLESAVPLDDLRNGGWHISAWKRDPAGGAAITLSRVFVGQDDLARRLADLTGSKGALRDPRITRTREWFGGTDKIAVTVDLRDIGAGVKSDAELAKRLQAAGLDVNTLDAQLTSELKDALHVTVAVHAPDGSSRTLALKAGGHGTVAASQSQTYARRLALLAAGAGLLLLALVITAASLRSRSRPRRTS
jgi:hypothetical protein